MIVKISKHQMIIDISKYQKVNDWNKVKSNVDGVYIKATEGIGYVDPGFRQNVIGASAANISIGFYHFATLNSADVIKDSSAEAKCFFDTTKGIKTGLPYALDIERNDAKLSQADVLKWIQNFVLTLHVYGLNDIVIYSYTPFLNDNLPKTHQLGQVLPLWLAAYTDKPKLPNGWDKYWLWQYTQKGEVDGITGYVDCSKKWQ